MPAPASFSSLPNVSVVSLKPICRDPLAQDVATGLLVSKNAVNTPSRVRAGFSPSAAGSGNCP